MSYSNQDRQIDTIDLDKDMYNVLILIGRQILEIANQIDRQIKIGQSFYILIQLDGQVQ